MSSAATNKNKVYYINVVIYLVILFGIGLIPPFGAITELGMKVLGVFIATIYGWMTLGLIWPSIFALVALGIADYVGIQQAFCDGFGYMNIPILIMSFVFAAIADQTHITEYLANWLTSRKIIVGRPYALMAVLFFGMEILNLLGTGFVGVFIIWGLIVSLAEAAGYQKGNAFVNFMIPSALVIFVISGFVFPFKTSSLIMLGIFSKGTNLAFPDLQYLIWQLIIVNLYIVILLLVAKFILRLDVSVLAQLTNDLGKEHRDEKMNSEQIFGLIMLLAYIVMMLLPMLLPKTWAFTQFLSKFGILGSLGVLISIAMAKRTPEGEPYVNFAKVAAKGISWDVIWLIVATTPLAAAFQAEECGIMTTLMGFLTPILTNMSPAIFIIACTIILGITTQFVHNLILGIVFIPILCPLCATLGGNPYACYLAINMALMMAFITPAASMNAGLIFGHPWLNAKTAYVQGTMHLVIGLSIALIIGLPLANILF